MRHIDQNIDDLGKIPDKKFWQKARKTLFGVGAIAAGVFFKSKGWFPDWFDMGLIALGGYSLSGELVRGFLKFIPAAIKDIKAALTNAK